MKRARFGVALATITWPCWAWAQRGTIPAGGTAPDPQVNIPQGNAGAGAGANAASVILQQLQNQQASGQADPAQGQQGQQGGGRGRGQSTGVMGGGNVTSSSSRPIAGPDDRDGFDLAPKAGAGGAVRGSENGPVFLESSRPEIRNQTVHTVKKGDTLWDICDANFKNPYQWPRVWSYNPQIQNPHWIYPGEQVRLRPQLQGPADENAQQESGNRLVDRRKQVPPQTIFLRNQGFISDENTQTWGELQGAPEDKMFLTDTDQAYIRITGDRDIKLGQELTLFRPVRRQGEGTVVQILGSVRVNQWNAKDRVARAQITETLDVIERGVRVGPVTRRFEIVPPARNDNDVKARIQASLYPWVYYSQNQIVFVDKGSEDGLRPGNRMQIIRKEDSWHQSLPSRGAARRLAMEKEGVAEVERVPSPSDPRALPEEVVGELRVLSVEPHSAACLVTTARSELEHGDIAIARKGY